MTPLRQRMIREPELRRRAPGTVTSYVKAVEESMRHFRRAPDGILPGSAARFNHVLSTMAVPRCDKTPCIVGRMRRASHKSAGS